MEYKRYYVDHWYPDKGGWANYFETDSLAAARIALETADPPEMQFDAYDYAMRNVRRRNRRRIYDGKEERTVAECEPVYRYVIMDKVMRRMALPVGLIIILVLAVLNSCWQ